MFRAAVEFEKKAHTENYEQGQAMEKNLISMAREMERLRAQLANAEKRAQAAAAASVNQGMSFKYWTSSQLVFLYCSLMAVLAGL